MAYAKGTARAINAYVKTARPARNRVGGLQPIPSTGSYQTVRMSTNRKPGKNKAAK